MSLWAAMAIGSALLSAKKAQDENFERDRRNKQRAKQRAMSMFTGYMPNEDESSINPLTSAIEGGITGGLSGYGFEQDKKRADLLNSILAAQAAQGQQPSSSPVQQGTTSDVRPMYQLPVNDINPNQSAAIAATNPLLGKRRPRTLFEALLAEDQIG